MSLVGIATHSEETLGNNEAPRPALYVPKAVTEAPDPLLYVQV